MDMYLVWPGVLLIFIVFDLIVFLLKIGFILAAIVKITRDD
jgi:hypothetical protein